MSIQHIKSNTIGDMTGTVTVFNSAGATTTAAASDLVRPSDWNSVHNVNYALGGNTVGSASVSGQDVAFFGGNNITLSADTLNSRVYFSGADTTQFLTTAQPPGAYLTTARASNDAIGLNTALTANGVAWTVNSSGLSLNVPAFLTTAAQSGHSHNLATTTTNGASIVVATTNSAGATIAVPSFLTTAAQSNHSHNFATTTTNGASIVVGTTNSAGATIGVPSFLTTAAQSNHSHNLATTTTGGSNIVVGTTNSAGATFGVPAFITTAALSDHSHGNPTLALTNLTGTTASNSAGFTLSLSAGAAGVVNQTGPNIAVAGSTVTSGDVMFSNANGVTFGMNGSTVTASVAAGGGGAPDRYYKEIIYGERFTTVAGMSNTAYTNRPMLMPFHLNGTGLECKSVRFMMSFGASSNRSLGGSFYCGIYSMANATQMTLVGSDSWSISSTASASSASWNGIAWVDFTGMSNVTLTAEGRYAMAVMVRPVSANQTWMPCTLYGADNMPNNQSRIWSNNATSSINATYQFVPFWGVYTATTSALPDSIGSNQLNNASSVKQIMYYANIKEI